jgi:hypothetical protein
MESLSENRTPPQLAGADAFGRLYENVPGHDRGGTFSISHSSYICKRYKFSVFASEISHPQILAASDRTLQWRMAVAVQMTEAVRLGVPNNYDGFLNVG